MIRFRNVRLEALSQQGGTQLHGSTARDSQPRVTK